MPDNGFGAKANSRDFLIRAYFLRPDFKTADGGSGEIEVGDHISFRDPFDRIGFPIVNEATMRGCSPAGTSTPSPCSADVMVTSGSATSSDHGSCTSTHAAGSSIRRSRCLGT